jgi:hypothetical protein
MAADAVFHVTLRRVHEREGTSRSGSAKAAHCRVARGDAHVKSQ